MTTSKSEPSRDLVRVVVARTLSTTEAPDHMLIIALMNACAYAHAFPERVPLRDQIVLRGAYQKLERTGAI